MARADKLKAQMELLDKEAELKRVKLMKELAMANAEGDALEHEEDANISNQDSNKDMR